MDGIFEIFDEENRPRLQGVAFKIVR